MQLVVPSAVSAAVSAAIAMRITISQKFFFIRFYLITFLPLFGRFSYLKVKSVALRTLKIIKKSI